MWTEKNESKITISKKFICKRLLRRVQFQKNWRSSAHLSSSTMFLVSCLPYLREKLSIKLIKNIEPIVNIIKYLETRN